MSHRTSGNVSMKIGHIDLMLATLLLIPPIGFTESPGQRECPDQKYLKQEWELARSYVLSTDGFSTAADGADEAARIRHPENLRYLEQLDGEASRPLLQIERMTSLINSPLTLAQYERVLANVGGDEIKALYELEAIVQEREKLRWAYDVLYPKEDGEIHEYPLPGEVPYCINDPHVRQADWAWPITKIRYGVTASENLVRYLASDPEKYQEARLKRSEIDDHEGRELRRQLEIEKEWFKRHQVEMKTEE